MYLLLQDAVKNDDVDTVRAFTSEVVKFAMPLLCRAVQSSSLGILELLLEACEGLQIDQSNVLRCAVEADNLAATQMLLDRIASISDSQDKLDDMDYIYFALRQRLPKMVELLLQYTTKDVFHKRKINIHYFKELIPSIPNPIEEANAIKCLGLLQNWIKSENFDQCFKLNARGCCSVAIASFLLQSGVDVDTCSKPLGFRSSTALYSASKKNNQRAAELIRFLLESGANPLFRSTLYARYIADRPGPKNIQKWLGITWEQLVKDSAKVYDASLAPTKVHDAIIRPNFTRKDWKPSIPNLLCADFE
ncbi:MAG: hypothetical protein Q9214_006046 [Letrouitia sp. 1 TL-2023]